MRLRRLAFQLVVTTLVAIGAVQLATALWFGAERFLAGRLDYGASVGLVLYPTMLAAAGAAAIAAVLVWRASDRPDARALGLFLTFLLLFWGAVGYMLTAPYLAAWPTWLARLSWLSFQVQFAAPWLCLAALVRFSALFPRRLSPDDLPPARNPRRPFARLRHALLDPVPVWTAGIGLAALNVLAWRVPATPLLGIDLQVLTMAVVFGVASVLFVLALSGIVRNLTAGYRLAGREERARVRWVVTGLLGSCYAILAGLAVTLVVWLLAELGMTGVVNVGGILAVGLIGLAPLVAVTCIGIGIFFAGSLDDELMVRKASIYGALGVALTVGFAAVEGAVSALLADRFGMGPAGGGIAASVAVGLALAVLRNPASRWVGGAAEPGAVKGAEAEPRRAV